MGVDKAENARKKFTKMLFLYTRQTLTILPHSKCLKFQARTITILGEIFSKVCYKNDEGVASWNPSRNWAKNGENGNLELEEA